MAIRKITIGLLFFVALFTSIIPNLTLAQSSNDRSYQLLVPIPEFCNGNTKDCTYVPGNFAKYVDALLRLTIILAAILSVIMIVFGGFQYMTSESMGMKEEGKERIQNAVVGLILLSASFLILNTINPNILNFNLDIKGIEAPKNENNNITQQTRDERDLASQGKTIIETENIQGLRSAKEKEDKRADFRKRCDGRGEFSTLQNGTILQCISTEMTP